MIVDSIYIKNFKCIEEKKYYFKTPFTIILGNNGWGKTSILEALTICSGVFTHNAGADPKYQRNLKRYEIHNKMINESFEPQYPCVLKAETPWGLMGREWESPSIRTPKVVSAEMVKRAKMLIDNGSKKEGSTLPLFAYYSTARLWSEMTDKLDYVTQGPRVEGYSYSLAAKSSSKYFREWYKTLDKNSEKKDENIRTRLQTFNNAIVSCVEDWDDIYFDFERGDIIGRHVLPNGREERIPYAMMSDGYRNMIGLVADLAFRCIKLNPHLGTEALKQTEGLVLIDELDMHLHPSWQRHVVRDLMACFPKMQFVATTHSPFIVQSVGTDSLIVLDDVVTSETSPNVMSIEDVISTKMGVSDSRMSVEYAEMMSVATEFYRELLSANSSEKEKQQLKEKLMLIEQRFSQNPAYVAFVKAKYELKFGENETD